MPKSLFEFSINNVQNNVLSCLIKRLKLELDWDSILTPISMWTSCNGWILFEFIDHS